MTKEKLTHIAFENLKKGNETISTDKRWISSWKMKQVIGILYERQKSVVNIGKTRKETVIIIIN